MKRILITGAGSYIGRSVERYLQEYNGENGRELYRVDTLSLREESWEAYDFSFYNTVFHVAGIAHADVGKARAEEQALYYQVNRDLAVRTAAKAKDQGVGQFIYMSSIIVYGDSAPVGKRRVITPETPPAPANFYGDSKLQAEKALRELEEERFRVAILRPPMIYGRGSKGNYPLLASLAGKLPVFPALENERSVLYVENLAEFVRRLIDSGKGGLFFPQNGETASTPELVRAIAKTRGKNIQFWRALNPLVSLAGKLPGKPGRLVNKAFGSLSYEQGMSRAAFDGYQRYSLRESIARTEGRQ